MGQTAISCTDRKLSGSLPELRLTEHPFSRQRPSYLTNFEVIKGLAVEACTFGRRSGGERLEEGVQCSRHQVSRQSWRGVHDCGIKIACDAGSTASNVGRVLTEESERTHQPHGAVSSGAFRVVPRLLRGVDGM
jgi:hypothetical protein